MNDNPDKKLVKAAIVKARRDSMRASATGDSGSKDFNDRKAKILAQTIKEGKKYDKKRIEKEKEKKHKEGNAKAAAVRKLYTKLGYKGNPGDFDLDESFSEKKEKLKRALKAGVKDKWKAKLALMATPGPFGEIAALGMTARAAYKAYKAQTD